MEGGGENLDRQARAKLSRGARAFALRFALAVLAVGGIVGSQRAIPDRSAHGDDEAFVPSPGVARLLAFGFNAVLADFYWMRAVQIVGSDQGAVGRNAVIGALIDVTTTLDPHVSHPYRFAAVWMTDDEPAVRKANELIRRGIAHHPDDWRGYFYLAFNHFFYLAEHQEASRALDQAIRLPGAPPYLTRLAARLKSQSGGGLDAAAAFLTELVRQSADPDERAEYESALREIETERRARFLDAARAEFVRRHKRDIVSVEELVSSGVLRALPPEPFGVGWEVSESTGEIVSSHVRYRYGVKIDPGSRRLIEQFKARSQRKVD
jgi:tetratricopeptide (TPR) repeat protein